MELDSVSRIAVMGGGPAGSFSAYFILDMAERIDLDIEVDIFEPKDFTRQGPAGCNHCGGIVSELLVQILATEGFILPAEVIRRGIEGYVLHSGETSLLIESPSGEKRIASVYRGAGPKVKGGVAFAGLDAHLLSLAKEKGATHKPLAVTGLYRREDDGRFMIEAGDQSFGPYDFVVGAIGIKARTLDILKNAGIEYAPPGTFKAYIAELHLGEEMLGKVIRNRMHVFLQNIPGVEMAALIPKTDYVTLCIVGEDVGRELVDKFLATAEMKRIFAEVPDFPSRVCNCQPLMNVKGVLRPYADRIALVGDCGVTRLYKDGIGSAYYLGKNLAAAAIIGGVSAADLEKYYMPHVKRVLRDNLVGKLIFVIVEMIKRVSPLRRGVMNMIAREQELPENRRPMSLVMWDTFTGSASYREILLRALKPGVLSRLFLETLKAVFTR